MKYPTLIFIIQCINFVHGTTKYFASDSLAEHVYKIIIIIIIHFSGKYCMILTLVYSNNNIAFMYAILSVGKCTVNTSTCRFVIKVK